jgi:hypothetical protein
MTQQQLMAESVRESKAWLTRYLKGFDDTNHTKQAPGLPNHVAWTLGHLALTLQRIAERIDGRPISESDFMTGAGAGGGGRERFDAESVSFGSRPVDDPSRYPGYARCVAIFENAIERSALAIQNADDATMAKPAKWGKGEVPTWTLPARMVFHNGTHCGQIVDLRRALGLGNILG